MAKLSRVSLAFNDRSIWEPCSRKLASDAVAIPAKGGFRAIPNKESSVVSSMADLRPVPEESLEEVMEAETNHEPLRSDAVLPDESVDIAHGTSYSQVERDVVAPQPRSPTEPRAPTASTQADSVLMQGLPSISVARPVLDASAVDCSKDIPRGSQEPRVPDRPRRKHRWRDHLGHQNRHSRPLQHDPRASGRSNKGGGSTIDRAVTEKRGKRPAKTPEQRKSQSSRPRVVHDRGRKRQGSLKQRLIGIIKVVLAAFGTLRGKRIT